MEQKPKNNTLNQNQQDDKSHHHHHRNPSDKKSGWKKIYRIILLVLGFTLIFFSITTENLLLALSGSLLLLGSMAFTDIYKKIARASGEILGSLGNTIDESKGHSHRRHHRKH